MLLSTRGGDSSTASGAILRGIAPDGGLYAPESFHTLSIQQIEALRPLAYAQRAQRILSLLLDDFTEAEIQAATEAAYGDRFEGGKPAPVRKLNGNTSMLELYHGPTLAFKDMALQILPHLMAQAAQKNGVTDEICILVATSGDTGKAALEGFCDVPGTRCAVFYPKDGVSHAQYLQMATQPGENTHVIAVEGNFDDCQTGVKRIFTDPAFGETMKAQGRRLSSANSINYGRLVPQVAYYFSAYVDLIENGTIRAGDLVHFVVPTGNFGNILAASYAKAMGLPIGKLLCASNANRVLADFIRSGAYDINRSFYKTSSPSMDILISSNLERYLFELSGRDAGQVRQWMETLSREKRYKVTGETLQRLQASMVGGWVSDREVLVTISRVFRQHNALMDPHTAVAAALLSRYREETGDLTPAVIVATANPYKFGKDVAKAIGLNVKDDFDACRAIFKLTGIPVPRQIAALESLPVRHGAVCPPDGMEAALLQAFAG